MYKSVAGKQLKGMIGKVNIIDIRKSYLYSLGNIPTSKNIVKSLLLLQPQLYLNKDEEYYIYCEQGSLSTQVCSELASKGYKVVNVKGGYYDYITS